MVAESGKFARLKTASEAAGRDESRAYDAGVGLRERSARLIAPSLLLALAMGLSGPQADRAQRDPCDHQTVVEHAPTGDTLLPPSDAKPCARKPANAATAIFISWVATGSRAERGPSSPGIPFVASTLAISFPGNRGGRAPPPAIL
jgi:hypothetical protein